METYETTQPWVVYTFGRTHDRWWPFWTSTRVLGHAKIDVECCICGAYEVVKMKIARFGAIPDKGNHPKRDALLRKHRHPRTRNNPRVWVKPLRNPAAFHAAGGS